jgi:serine/threonine protein kinase
MNCFSCSKKITNKIKCDKCNNKFCSDSCLAFHYIFYHNEENINEELINNDNNNLNEDFNNDNFNNNNISPYITKAYFLKEIKYESIYDIKNFNHYLINGKPKLLGYGSFGKVYLEINKINKKLYAIKHMEKKTIKKALNTLDPIYSEIQIQSKISHPNIVKILYANENEKYFDIVLEYATNGNLFYFIQKNKHLSESKSFKIFIQMVNAIYFLHQNNYIHRDIKPENILLFENDVAKLCDFGWCVEFKDEPRNTFCGTTEYMAPEMLNQKKYGKEIDVWSLGILLYEMLHGHSPFKPDKNDFCDIDVIRNIRFQKNVKYNNKLSSECIELMSHLIDKNIKRRYNLDDILNSKFVKNFEKLQYFLPKKNITEFRKIDNNNKFNTINTSISHYTNVNNSERNNINKNITRRKTSKNDSDNNILNTFFSMESNETKRESRENKIQNKYYYKSLSQPKTRRLNTKFSSPKVEKINKNKLQKEEEFENDNLSNIFNDDSVFNNKKSEKHQTNYQNPPTININILLNEINFSSIHNENYENKFINKILFKKATDNINRNSSKILVRNSNSSKNNDENIFNKRKINISTTFRSDIKNLKDLKSNNNSKNVPISIRPKNKNIPINEIKIKKLVNYFDSSDKKKENEKENSFSHINKLNNNINIDNNKNSIINEKPKSEISIKKLNLNKETTFKLGDILIDSKNHYDLNSLESPKNKINSEYNSKNTEINKTPKKVEDKFQIAPKNIISNLLEELNSFNKKSKF